MKLVRSKRTSSSKNTTWRLEKPRTKRSKSLSRNAPRKLEQTNVKPLTRSSNATGLAVPPLKQHKTESSLFRFHIKFWIKSANFTPKTFHYIPPQNCTQLLPTKTQPKVKHENEIFDESDGEMKLSAGQSTRDSSSFVRRLSFGFSCLPQLADS